MMLGWSRRKSSGWDVQNPLYLGVLVTSSFAPPPDAKLPTARRVCFLIGTSFVKLSPRPFAHLLLDDSIGQKSNVVIL